MSAPTPKPSPAAVSPAQPERDFRHVRNEARLAAVVQAAYILEETGR